MNIVLTLVKCLTLLEKAACLPEMDVLLWLGCVCRQLLTGYFMCVLKWVVSALELAVGFPQQEEARRSPSGVLMLFRKKDMISSLTVITP